MPRSQMVGLIVLTAVAAIVIGCFATGRREAPGSPAGGAGRSDASAVQPTLQGTDLATQQGRMNDGPPDEHQPPKSPNEKAPEGVRIAACDLFLRSFEAAHREKLPADGWQDRLHTNLSWVDERKCWSAGGFEMEWPSGVLRRLGGPGKTAMPQGVERQELDSWMRTQVEDGRAIPLEDARRIAVAFAERQVPDWKSRNYVIGEACRETSDVSVDASRKVSHAWYRILLVQAPFTELGEVLVTAAPILIWIDPWTSEILWFVRNPQAPGRIEPRIAFRGPLLQEQDARRLLERRVQSLNQARSTNPRTADEVNLQLRVLVTWDALDVPAGRPIWDLQFVLKSGEYGQVGNMKVDARSGEILEFAIE